MSIYYKILCVVIGGNKKAYRPLIITFLLFCSPSYADSPLTATTFYKAYLDVPIVKQADRTHNLNKTMADYLLNDQNPFDVKLAVINALSWEENVSENVHNLLDSLEIKHGENFLNESVGSVDQHEFFLLAYFMALGRYERPWDFINNLNVVKHELNQSFSVAVITALTRAQFAHLMTEDTFYDMARNKARKLSQDPDNSELSKDEIEALALIRTMKDIGNGIMTKDYRNYRCTEWLIVDEVLNDDSLAMDMRPEAKEIIAKYMESYQGYCDGIEEYWKTSNTRG